jgi:hypothetical protein
MEHPAEEVTRVRYIELQATEAARLGHSAIDAADRHSQAGVVRAQVAPKQAGPPLAVGARLVRAMASRFLLRLCPSAR